MPKFDFQCQACKHVFEHSRPFGSKDTPPCPECKSPKTQKLIATPAIHFKGDGFYATDSISSPPKKKKESELKKEQKQTNKGQKTENKTQNNDSKAKESGS
jgi:putative FmdB family regulatory protein